MCVSKCERIVAVGTHASVRSDWQQAGTLYHSIHLALSDHFNVCHCEKYTLTVWQSNFQVIYADMAVMSFRYPTSELATTLITFQLNEESHFFLTPLLVTFLLVYLMVNNSVNSLRSSVVHVSPLELLGSPPVQFFFLS